MTVGKHTLLERRISNILAADLANAVFLWAFVRLLGLERTEDWLERTDGRALAIIDDRRGQNAVENTPLQHGGSKVERVQFLPTQSVQGRDHRGAIWVVEKITASNAALVLWDRVLSLQVLKLLISVKQTEPASNALLASFWGIVDLSVVFETRSVAEFLVVAKVAEWEDGKVPGTVDIVTDTHAIGAVSEGALKFVRIIRAGEVAMTVCDCLIASLLNLDLLMQA